MYHLQFLLAGLIMDIPNDSDEEKDAKFKEFGPITPDDKDHSGFGGFLSSFFRWRKSKYEGENSNKHHENESFNNAPYPIWLPPSENTATAPVDSGSLTNINSEANESGKKKYQLGSETVTISYERHLHYVLKRIKTIAEKKDSDMKDHWVPDSHRKECYDCSEKFTQLRRKHHCRICGQIFCSKCCNKVISTKPMGFKGELKVCTYCFKVFSCCIKTNNFEEDVMADIILLEEELLPVVNASNLPSGELTGEHERRLILEKRKRRGFMEENYTVKSRSFNSDFTSRVDQNDLDKIASERQLLLKDSQQLQSLWMCMVSGPNKLHLSTNRHRLKAFSETFIGRDFVQWMVDNDKASCRQSAIAIGQALLEAGFIFCVSQQEQQFSDEHVLYTALKPHDFKEKTTAPQSMSVTHDMGQEPLWLKQISSQVESDNILPSKAAFTNAPFDSLQNVSASSSNYSLDLNVKENVVSLKHPGRRKGVTDNETETDMARGLETSVSAVLNDTIYSFSSEQQSSGTVMTEEVLELKCLSLYSILSLIWVSKPETAGYFVLEAVGENVFCMVALKSLEPKLAETRAAGWQIKNEDENLGREIEVDEQTRTSLVAKKKLSENWRHFENRLLLLLLSNMEIDISWSTTILSLVYKVVDTVCPDVKNESDDMDIRQ
ncbi:Lateral signaling target protein 2-like protein [Armadillidium nasatum]|uniref:Lateral signaling target protein 2-like protein n=1 Tax=Armadillidium nasatum TaxID=96803 RepID=A0A5N5SWN0_9CRUS|nr:Lateral signaling target protein 2-like protein [Armadillidium nasatum]